MVSIPSRGGLIPPMKSVEFWMTSHVLLWLHSRLCLFNGSGLWLVRGSVPSSQKCTTYMAIDISYFHHIYVIGSPDRYKTEKCLMLKILRMVQFKSWLTHCQNRFSIIVMCRCVMSYQDSTKKRLSGYKQARSWCSLKEALCNVYRCYWRIVQ